MNDYPPDIEAMADNHSAQVIQIDSSKHVVVIAICAVLCGFCASISWWSAVHFRDDSIDIQTQYERERNHVIELEARQKVLADDLQEMKHERR